MKGDWEEKVWMLLDSPTHPASAANSSREFANPSLKAYLQSLEYAELKADIFGRQKLKSIKMVILTAESFGLRT